MAQVPDPNRPPNRRPGSVREVLLVALRLGLTSFGGPVAHLGYFRREYVDRRQWLDEATYADLLSLCQLLPGPASSELGIAIGTLRAGRLGGLAAWLGFTLPSAVALTLFALLSSNVDLATAGWVEGLKLAAVAVVAQAVLVMARTLTPDRLRASIAVLAAIAMLLAPLPAFQVLVILAGGALGWRLLGSGYSFSEARRSVRRGRRTCCGSPTRPRNAEQEISRRHRTVTRMMGGYSALSPLN